ncbi:hypothetical protein BH09SUM1_BH09SUM1_06990 [soil metagenome]
MGVRDFCSSGSEFIPMPNSMPVKMPRALSVAILLLLTSRLSAERLYQKYWREQMEKEKPPVIIDNGNPPRDLRGEKFLYGDNLNVPINPTVFDGKPSSIEPVPSDGSLKSYINGAYDSETGNMVESLRFFQDAADKNPENTWMRLRAASAALAMNDVSSAEAILKKILAEDPKNYRAMLLMAQTAMAKQKLDDAREWYGKVLEIKSGNIDSLEALSQISYEIDHDWTKTRDYAQRILLIDDRNWNAVLWSADANAYLGDANAAADYYERLMRFRPDLVSRVISVARQLEAKGEGANARILYDRAMLITPDNNAVRQLWEASVLKTDGKDGLKAAYDKLMEQSHDDEKVADVYAAYLRREKDWDGLTAVREKMLQSDPNNVNALLDIGGHYLTMKDTAKAKEYFDRAQQAGAADADVHRRIAEAYLAAGDLVAAEDNFRRALALDPKDVMTLSALAMISQQKGNGADSEKLLRDALEASPANPVLLRRLAAVYLETGQRAKAKDLFQQTLASDSDDLDAWLALAQIYYEDNDEIGLKNYETLAAPKMTGSAEFHLRFGALAQQFGDFERSRIHLEKSLKIDPNNTTVRMALAHSYHVLGKDDLAIKVVKDQNAGNTPELKQQRDAMLASIYMDIGRYDDAADSMKKLLEANPDDFKTREQYLIALIKGGKNDDATKELNEVVRVFGASKPIDTQELRASVYRARGEMDRALPILRKLAEENTTNDDLKFELASTAGEAEDRATAEKYYRQIIDRGAVADNKYYETALNNLGYMFADKGERLDEAEKLTQQALAISPNAGYILDSVGWVYFKKGDYANARKYLERAVRFSGGDGEVLSNLGQVYEEMGEKELAKGAYERALRVDPKLKIARERRDALAAGAPNSAPK